MATPAKRAKGKVRRPNKKTIEEILLNVRKPRNTKAQKNLSEFVEQQRRKDRIDQYTLTAQAAIANGEGEALVEAVITASATHGLMDAVVRQNANLFMWALQRMRTNRMADANGRIAEPQVGCVEDPDDDNMSEEEGIRRDLMDDSSFP